MDSTVTAAIIGAAGVIFGGVVKTLAPDLKPLLSGKARANSDLVHEWKVTWFVRKEDGGGQIDDVVMISRMGRKVLGRRFEYGVWWLRDYRTSFSVLSSYPPLRGREAEANTGGRCDNETKRNA